MSSEKRLEEAVERRVRDWFRSTSETYAQPVGSDPWVKGLVGYVMRGPGAVAPLLATLDTAAEGPTWETGYREGVAVTEGMNAQATEEAEARAEAAEKALDRTSMEDFRNVAAEAVEQRRRAEADERKVAAVEVVLGDMAQSPPTSLDDALRRLLALRAALDTAAEEQP